MSFPRRRSSRIAFNAFYFLIYFYYFYFLGVKVVGRIQTKDRPLIIVANHRSFNDPPALGTLVYSVRHSNEVHALAKSELFEIHPIFSRILRILHSIPLQRDGLDLSAISHTLELLKKGDYIIIFPEGTRNKTKDLLEGKPGAGYLALKSKAKVIPVFIKNSDKSFITQLLRINRMEIRFGEAIELPDMRPNSANSRLATQIMMKEIGALDD
ncbi:MAG: lysophospholipid acyltransferase family protein [bacterium]|nr:lysophospholipid acyltransferase family protein [bacterium]